VEKEEESSSSLMPSSDAPPPVSPAAGVKATEPQPLGMGHVDQAGLRDSQPKVEDGPSLDPKPMPDPTPIIDPKPMPEPVKTEPMTRIEPMPQKQEISQPAPLPLLTTEPTPLPTMQAVRKQEEPALPAPTLKPAEATAPVFPNPAVRSAATRPAELRQHSTRVASPAPVRRMVNSRRITLDYDLADVPSPERSHLELWYTQDGRSWFKDQTEVKCGEPYVIEVNREGTYGFMMVARQPGEKSQPPGPSEQPQAWVEVDWTRPVVSLMNVIPGRTASGRSVSIMWNASDSHMADSPITLSWSETPTGEWKTFATKVENSGRYVWQVPSNVPGEIYLRVEALDTVGNSGVAQTPGTVQLP
jgi:hypothetical protein